MDRAAYEAALEPLCRAQGLGVINFFGLARGVLTGKYRSEADLGKSPRGAGCKAYLTDRGYRVLAVLDAAAQARGATPAQVALAWQIARPGLSVARRHRLRRVMVWLRGAMLLLVVGVLTAGRLGVLQGQPATDPGLHRAG